MRSILKTIRTPIRVTLLLVILCGVIYPLIVTGISQLVFPYQANGSVIKVGEKAVGSERVGQQFTDSRFMKVRPSAVNYNTYTEIEKSNGTYQGIASGSRNYAPSNPKLVERVKKDVEQFLKENPTIKKEAIPVDLVTASGSGLDPHISPSSATIQIPKLMQTTRLSEEKLKAIIHKHTTEKLWGIFGEPTVNVLKVNLDIAKELGILE